MKIIINLAVIALSSIITSVTFAQNTRFISSGTIEFEKKVNMFALIKKRINKNNESYMSKYYEEYKSKQPQFKTFKNTLSFSNNKTLYKPVETDEATTNDFFFGSDPSIDLKSVIYTDLATHFSASQKSVFEETFLVKDSTRKINWKITDETRTIAGYECRRANALILDSIYVVAFYTDEILPSGGPESFTGLPGMILGVALPHDNVTWFATKVTDTAVLPTALTPPTKGKVLDKKGLKATIEASLKDWGDYAKPLLKALQI